MANLQLSLATDVGRKRQGNEDAVVALVPPDAPGSVDAVFVVADGMGGHEAGEIASAIVVRTLVERFGPGSPFHAGGAAPGAEDLRRAVQEANAAIVAEAQGDKKGMGTTATAGIIEQSRLHIAHVGDSRAYMLRGGRLYMLTQDHSWVAEQVRAGALKPEEAATHPRRNLLTRALGTGDHVEVDAQTIPLEQDDLILLCSDGLYGVVPDEKIREELLKTPDLQAVCDHLVAEANRMGGPDNITVLVARHGEEEKPAGTSDRTSSTLVPGRRRRSKRLVALALLVLAAAAGAAAVGYLSGVGPFS